MKQAQLPDWEPSIIEEAIVTAEERYEDEQSRSRRRAVQLAREQGYHRLALEIDRPKQGPTDHHPGQLSFFPTDPTLFDELPP